MSKIQLICITLLCLSQLTTLSFALYEDQVGKFDWKKEFIGKVTYADFDHKKVIVATEENVLASLSIKTGNITWRKLLEDPSENKIKLLKVNNHILTISGKPGTWYVRTWDKETGSLISEWLLSSEKISDCEFTIIDGKLIQIIPENNIEINIYNVQNGIIEEGSTIDVPFKIDTSKCVLAETYYTCVNNENLYYVNIYTRGHVESFNLNHLKNDVENFSIKKFKDKEPAILLSTNSLNSHIIYFQQDSGPKVHSSTVMPNAASVTGEGKSVIFQLEGSSNPSNIIIKTSEVNKDIETIKEVEYPKGLGKPDIAGGQCLNTICDLLLTTSDNALLIVRLPEGKILWTREEALSKIVASEFLDLPVSELEASIETEFKASDFITMLSHRLSAQLKQLSNYLFGNQLLSNYALVRDDFGLHKIIVVATEAGKLFGIDTLTGSLAWSYRLPNIRPFKILGVNKMLLFVQRTARYPPLRAQCMLLAEDALTGNGIIFQFDPITGYSEKSIQRLSYPIAQALLLPTEDKNHIKPVVIYSVDNKVYTYPEDAKNFIKEESSNTYLYTVDSKTNTLKGFNLFKLDETIKTKLIWEIHLGSSTLVALGAKSPNERVHSQGRVLPDRSVYYKYVNPNLVALATITDDPIHKQVLSVYLIDGITGLIVYSTAHKRAKGPIHLVHSENWLVYSYFSDRFRRTEVVAAELYEGDIQSNSTVFSSLASTHLPHVETQAYILPAFPLKIAVTLTERGITNKFLLIALSNGGVVEIPWLLLQPRFENVPCGPEESCIPYMPEIPLPLEAYINYYHELGRIRDIEVAPARLESTSHVLVYGLDLFYTRVAPSKTFDLLKDDFDHRLIILVLTGLIAASYITKYFASQKALKQAWK